MSFTFDEVESRKIRDQLKLVLVQRSLIVSSIGMLLQLGQPMIRFSRYGFSDLFGWAEAAMFLLFAALMIGIVLQRRFAISPALRASIATVVTFEDSAIRLTRTDLRTTHEKTIAFSKIHRISMTADAFAVATGPSPTLVIPKRAFADGGTAFWQFFDERLVGKRMLRRSTPTTSIVNTALR